MKHGHQPHATPIASSSGRLSPSPISSTACSSVSFIAIRSSTWPVAVTEPSSISVAPQLDRIEPEGLGELVHVLLERPADLARSARGIDGEGWLFE